MKIDTAKNILGKHTDRTLKGLQSCTLAFALITTLTPAAHADVLLGYDVNGRTGSPPSPAYVTPTTTAADVTASDLTLGSGLTYSAANNVLIASGFTVAPSSYAAAVTASDYFTFSLSATAGNALQLDSLVYNLRIVEANSPTTSQWAFSLDNVNYTALGDPLVVAATAATHVGLTVSLDGIAALQDVTGPVYFRLYGWNSATTGGRMGIGNGTGNDLVINGTIAPIPEPGTWLLLSLGLAALFLHHRRRRAA